MANQKFPDNFSAPSSKEEAQSTANRLISKMSSEEKSELQSILDDRGKINEILNSPAAQKIMQKLNEKKDGH